jgi:hypothetical protein
MSPISNNSLINGTGADDPPPFSPEKQMQHPRMVWRAVAPDSILKNIEVMEGQRYEFRVFDLPEGSPVPEGWSQAPWIEAAALGTDTPAESTAEEPKKKRAKSTEPVTDVNGN